MPKRKTPVDLNALADEANLAMNSLYGLGYEKEVDAIRNFIRAQGEHFVKMQKVARDIAAQLGRDR